MCITLQHTCTSIPQDSLVDMCTTHHRAKFDVTKAAAASPTSSLERLPEEPSATREGSDSDESIGSTGTTSTLRSFYSVGGTRSLRRTRRVSRNAYVKDYGMAMACGHHLHTHAFSFPFVVSLASSQLGAVVTGRRKRRPGQRRARVGHSLRTNCMQHLRLQLGPGNSSPATAGAIRSKRRRGSTETHHTR